jgi:hypothetical protein
MSERQVKHFLILYDILLGEATVTPFDKDYESAVSAYERLEQEHREDPNVEVVLLGSDSIDTLRRTHSSYFELREHHIDQVVARELADLGLR